MNCKPGDLAVVVSSAAGNEGKIVKCLQHVRHPFIDAGVLDAWLTEPMLRNVLGKQVPSPDFRLRPIRDPGDDAVDESKAWLPPVPLPIIDPELLEVGK